MTTAQAAHELGISHRACQRAIKSGRLPAARVGKRVFVVTVDDLKKFREACGAQPAPEEVPLHRVTKSADPLQCFDQYFHRTDRRSYVGDSSPRIEKPAPLQPRSGAGELAPALQGGPLTNCPAPNSGNWTHPDVLKARGEQGARDLDEQYRYGKR